MIDLWETKKTDVHLETVFYKTSSLLLVCKLRQDKVKIFLQLNE